MDLLRNRFYSKILALLAVSMLLLAACAPAAAGPTDTAAPEQTATQRPEVSQTATEKPATAQPTATAGCEATIPQAGPAEVAITGAICLTYPLGQTRVDEVEGGSHYAISLAIEAEPEDPFFPDGVTMFVPMAIQPGSYAIGTNEYEEGVNDKISATFLYRENGRVYLFESLEGSIQLTATGDPYLGAVYSGSFAFSAIISTDPSKMIMVSGNFEHATNVP